MAQGGGRGGRGAGRERWKDSQPVRMRDSLRLLRETGVDWMMQSRLPKRVDASRHSLPSPNQCATMELFFFSNGLFWFAVSAGRSLRADGWKKYINYLSAETAVAEQLRETLMAWRSDGSEALQSGTASCLSTLFATTPPKMWCSADRWQDVKSRGFLQAGSRSCSVPPLFNDFQSDGSCCWKMKKKRDKRNK